MAIEVKVIEKTKGFRRMVLRDDKRSLRILVSAYPPVRDPESGRVIMGPEQAVTMVYSGPPNGSLWAKAHQLKKVLPNATLETVLPSDIPF